MSRIPISRVATLALWILGVPAVAVAQNAPPAAAPSPQTVQTTVLQMAPDRNWAGGAGTIWRYYETWQSDLVRLKSGQLASVDPLKPRKNYDGAKLFSDQGGGRQGKEMEFELLETKKVVGSPFPPADWMTNGFDDGRWVRTATPMLSSYRSLALICLRGKFTVKEPASVAELSLEADVQGGAVFYLNGKEVGRTSLPQGKIDFDTPAEDYPTEAFFDASGMPLPHRARTIWDEGGSPMSLTEFCSRQQNPDLQARYKKRFRHVSLKVPAAALRPGVNVLAVEVHRSPAVEAMFTKVYPKKMGYGLSDQYFHFWNRVSLDELKLTAKAAPGSVVANVSRPATVQAWNHSIWEYVDAREYGDPNEPLRPLEICGARNGTFSDQIVVSSTGPVKGVKVDFETPGNQGIPRAWLRIGYAALECIENKPPDEVRPMQPIWVMTDIPKDAKPGDYKASLTVSAEGLAPATVPIELHVSGWTLPEPQDYTTHMAFVESPDSLAISYGVPMWSKEHWRLIDESFRVLGTLATKELNIPLVRRSHFGNEHGMVWFEKDPDGSYKPYLDIVDKYVDVAVKHLGKIPVVCFYVIEADADGCPWITEFDPSTWAVKNSKAPPWGTEEARKFWMPAFEGFRKILAKHGMEKSMVLGYHAAGADGPIARAELIQDMKVVAPEARWVRLSHEWYLAGRDSAPDKGLDQGPNGNPWARVALVAGNYGVGWDPDTDKPFYGWQNPYVVTAYPRDACFKEHSEPWVYRLAPETVLLSGQRVGMPGWGMCDIAGQFGRDTFLGSRGFGPMGADFFAGIIGRYNDPAAAHWDPRSFWYTVGLANGGIIRIIGRGREGPVPSIRTEALREGLEEAEARVFCQNALLDEKLKAKLGPDLAGRCKVLCDNRTRAFRYLSEFRAFGTGKGQVEQPYVFDPGAWRDRSRQLYDMAGEVARALGKP